jgi:alpha-glucosidase
MDRIPIYARGGAVIPMWPEAPPSTAGYHPSVIELHLFVPDVDGTHLSLLQEDDGLTFAALGGARYRTTFEVTCSGDRISLRGVVDGHGYAEFVREAFHLVIHGATPNTVRLDGSELGMTGQHFVLPNSGSSFTIEFVI